MFKPGECVAVTEKSRTITRTNKLTVIRPWMPPLRVVDCNADHQYEVTDIVDLGESSKNTRPLEDQNEYLNKRCTGSVTTFIGGDDKLYNSTPEPFWTTLTEDSWRVGSPERQLLSEIKTGDNNSPIHFEGLCKGVNSLSMAIRPHHSRAVHPKTRKLGSVMISRI